jgi:hypothetical protein
MAIFNFIRFLSRNTDNSFELWKNIVIYSGTWRVEEICWDWAYEGNSMIERDVTSLSSLTDRTFTFTATKTTDLKESQYSESVVINDFSSGEVVTK